MLKCTGVEGIQGIEIRDSQYLWDGPYPWEGPYPWDSPYPQGHCPKSVKLEPLALALHSAARCRRGFASRREAVLAKARAGKRRL